MFRSASEIGKRPLPKILSPMRKTRSSSSRRNIGYFFLPDRNKIHGHPFRIISRIGNQNGSVPFLKGVNHELLVSARGNCAADCPALRISFLPIYRLVTTAPPAARAVNRLRKMVLKEFTRNTPSPPMPSKANFSNHDWKT